MKSLCFSTLLALFYLFSAHAAKNEKHLFILSGQSNMELLDPKVSFTPAVEAVFGKDNVVVVKDAQGGQPIRRWYKKWKPSQGENPGAPGDLYDRLMEMVNKASKGKKFATVTFIWMQGERDAREKHGEVYAESLRGLLEQLSADLGRQDINFVIGRLSDFDMDDKKYPHWTMVRKAQVEVAEGYPRGAELFSYVARIGERTRPVLAVGRRWTSEQLSGNLPNPTQWS